MSSNGTLINPNSPGVGQEEVYALVAFWFNTLIYGAYLSLFISSFSELWKGWRRGTSKVFFVGMCLMFLLTTLDALVTAHLNVYAYTWGLSNQEGPLGILNTWSRWDRFTHSVMISLVLWIADFLAIYRCYIVWQKSWKIILVPSVIFLLSMSIGIVNLHWFLHPEKTWLRPTVWIFLDMCYPLHLGQNILTTGLIAFKIWKQHLRSAQSGVRAYAGIRLVYVLRIIFESAMIYTLQMLVLVILFRLRHRAMVIFQTGLAPSASIVFVLMITRVEMARTQDRDIQGGGRSFKLPSWLDATSPSEGSGSSQTIDRAVVKEEAGIASVTPQPIEPRT